MVDYDGDSEEDEEADAVSGEVDGSEPKKGIDLAVAAPEVSPVEGEDYDVESPNKRAKLT